MPHVDVLYKHFGVALGEARTFRTATKGAPGTQDRTSEMATRKDGIRTRGAGRVRGLCFCARKTRGNRGNIGIAPPLESVCPNFAQSDGWRLALGHMVGNVTGNERGAMTGAHLGDRGACRRRSCSATAAPREGARRRGHGDGRHHPRPQRSFFSPNSDRRVIFVPVTEIMLMDQPHRF